MTDNKRTLAHNGSTSANPLNDEFATFARNTLEEWKVPGLSLAVIDGEDIYAEGYGMATFPDTPATPSTIWYAASTTKAFTDALLSHMIESGAYPSLAAGWATPISSLIRDDFVLQDAWATQNLTLEDAATHRTGLPRHDKSSMREHEDGTQVTIKEIVRNLRHLSITEPPRTKFLYNNFMYVVLSHVIETLRGQSMEDALREVIWEPLGMKDTVFSVEDALKGKEHFATCYFYDEEAEEFKVVPPMEEREGSGAGAIMSNALDYARWVKCLLHEEAPLSKKVHEDIKTPRIVGSMPEGPLDVTLYCLGWERSVYRNTAYYKHDGGMHAAGATVLFIPSLKFGVVAFANTCLTSNAAIDTLAWRLVDGKLGLPEEEWTTLAGVKWRGLVSEAKEKYSNAVNVVFPSLPDPTLPPTITIKEAIGKYYDEGYKGMELQAAPHPDKPGEQILTAPRDNMTWSSRVELHHVSGDYWILWYMPVDVITPYLRDYMRAEFKRGPDGKVASLEVVMEKQVGYQFEGHVSFKRVS